MYNYIHSVNCLALANLLAGCFSAGQLITLAIGVLVFAVVVILTGCALVPGAALYRQLFPGEWCCGGDPDWVCPGARCRPLSPAVPR